VTISQAFEIAFGHHQRGQLGQAEAIYRQILAVQPHHADALQLLGLIAIQSGRNDVGAELIRKAIDLAPNIPAYHCNLGIALAGAGRLDESIDAYRSAIQLNPEYAEAYTNLGNAHRNQGRFLEAETEYRRALALGSDRWETHYGLGTALRRLFKLHEAVAAYRRTIELNPGFAHAHHDLGIVLGLQGRFEEAKDANQQAIVLQPDMQSAQSNRLAILHYDPQTTLADLFEAHCEYDRRFALNLRSTWRPYQNLPDPDRPLRVGFISPHFRNHPVGRFLIRPLENLDARQVQVICYSDTHVPDEMTDRIRARAAGWHEVSALGNGQLEQLIRADAIDILFDLAGHTAGNRLQVFARKPAPIQITWMDYVGTTGLTAMDYILGDLRQIPPGAERWYREQVLRMPDDYICYDPPADSPPVGALPALSNGCIRFGSFNIPLKITPRMIEVWTRILHRVPGARLVLKNRGLDDPSTSDRYRRAFAEHGVRGERLELLGWSPPNDVLACYERIDIGLDTFPYNGGLTTCEAIWMGVPVITCPGETFASRHGLAHLSAAGLHETIAGTLDDYVERAVTLASDLPRLADLRAKLRDRVAASPLCDGSRFATHFMEILRDAWRRWCANAGR
jgi:predicted O-linked N-acetylglucosamine transferase (SPINDLY family)